MNLIRGRHGNIPASCHSCLLAGSPNKHQSSLVTPQMNRESKAECRSDRFSLNLSEPAFVEYKHVFMYLGVEALCILSDPIELRESEHVLLAARPVKYSQSERRQRSKYLDCTQDKYAIIKAHNLMMSQTHTHSLSSWTICVYNRSTALKEFCSVLKMG